MVQVPVLTARSLLFVPGDSDKKFEKAKNSAADLLLIDLEDAVAESAKPDARIMVHDNLKAFTGSNRPWVRINPIDTPHALPDLAAIVRARPGGIMLPKVRDRRDVERLDAYLSALEVQAGVPEGEIRVIIVATETPEGLFSIGDYKGAPRLAAMTWGAEDIATAMGALNNRDDNGVYCHEYQWIRSLCIAGASAAGVTPIETVHTNFRDVEGLKAVAAMARRSGFRGMMAIHPDQAEPINAAFTPSEAEVEKAQRIVDLFAANPGKGTIGLDGEMLDAPHWKRAQATLALMASLKK